MHPSACVALLCPQPPCSPALSRLVDRASVCASDMAVGLQVAFLKWRDSQISPEVKCHASRGRRPLPGWMQTPLATLHGRPLDVQCRRRSRSRGCRLKISKRCHLVLSRQPAPQHASRYTVVGAQSHGRSVAGKELHRHSAKGCATWHAQRRCLLPLPQP